MKILISGAGIAGPTLAYWLRAYGFTPTIVERAPFMRTEGYVIDFWGGGYDVAERMGILPSLLMSGYKLREVRFVDKSGKKSGGFSADVFDKPTRGRFISLPRGSLCAALNGRIRDRVETLFDDEIVQLDQHAGGVDVDFAHASGRDFDLVIGADGLHSAVRAQAFGPEPRFAHYLGYKVAAFETAGYQPRDELAYVSYARPGLQAARYALRDNRTLFLLVAADPSSSVPDTRAEREAYLRSRFANAGWECDRILGEMADATDLYLDVVSQIEMSPWSKGRLALVGDAAACPSLLAGEGASLAMTGAYVLAGELHRAAGDWATAFARYETQLQPLMRRKQRSAKMFASSFAPQTMFGVIARNLVTRAMALPFVADLALGASLRDDFALPDYSVAPIPINELRDVRHRRAL